MFVVVWYEWTEGRGNLVYSGGNKRLAEDIFEVCELSNLVVEYQEWDDDGTLVHYKYKGDGSL